MTNTIAMPNPPGGTLTCGKGQIAKVKVQNGQIFAECCMPPSGVRIAVRRRYTDEFLVWAFTTVTEGLRGVFSPYFYPAPPIIDSGALRELLLGGEITGVTVDGNMVTVLFRLPPEVEDDETPPEVMAR